MTRRKEILAAGGGARDERASGHSRGHSPVFAKKQSSPSRLWLRGKEEGRRLCVRRTFITASAQQMNYEHLCARPQGWLDPTKTSWPIPGVIQHKIYKQSRSEQGVVVSVLISLLSSDHHQTEEVAKRVPLPTSN